MVMEPGQRLDGLVESVVLERRAGGRVPPYSTDPEIASTALRRAMRPGWTYDVEEIAGGFRCDCFRAGARRASEGGGRSEKILTVSATGRTRAHAVCLVALDLKLSRWKRGPRGSRGSAPPPT
jgi:hypothetical protein